jgi:protein involved in polysaccharide export with SLBB domain
MEEVRKLNFAKFSALYTRTLIHAALCLTIFLCVGLAGCGDQVRLPSAKELEEFRNAGFSYPSEDMNRPVIPGSKAFRIVPGDVLEITMPAILQVVTKEEPGNTDTVTQSYRVNETGTITLPVVGEIEVTGKTLSQIETTIIDAYYPKYASVRPTIFVGLAEQREPLLFSVLGLVNKPGNFPYPQDIQYNLMQALGFAEGLDKAAEPRFATIYRLKQDGTIASAVFQVVNTGNQSMLANAMNICIKPGDVVDVEHTPRTRTKLFLDGLFGINIGAYYRFDDALNN